MKPLLLTLNLLCGADAGTTHVALNHGAGEAWLPSQNPWVLDAVTVGIAVGETYTLERLSRQHPKLSRGLTWTFIGVRAAAVTNNLYQIRRQTR